MSSFESDLIQSAIRSMVKQISNADFMRIDYNDRIKLPIDFIDSAWDLVDKESLKLKLTARLESELVDRIVNHMASEIATDIKQILSIKDRREKIRAIARDNLDSIVGDK